MSLMTSFVEGLPRLPPKDERGQTGNPIQLIRLLTPLQLAFFFSGWLAWVCDAIDFFAVSLSTSRLAPYFVKPVGTVTLSITLTLLFRPLGAFIFGLLTDRYGRKWPLVANLLIIAALSLGTGFVHTFSAFLAVRSLFGIGMGGIWGASAALGLENMPVEARGLFSGIFQLGYSVGYLVIACINLNSYIGSSTHWRVLFYVSAGFSLMAAIIRLVLPESTYFVERQHAKREAEINGDVDERTNTQKSVFFLKAIGKMLRIHWLRCIYGLIFMTAFNFYSHSLQDLFPTYIQNEKGFSAHTATVLTIIGNCGAIAGCSIGGWASQFLGRRITIIIMCCFCSAMLPLWLLPKSFAGLAAGAFFAQAGVQGAYGVVPIYLSEISPLAFRAMWPGLMYQLGNAASSGAAQIEARAGEHIKNAVTGRPAYGKVSAILAGVAAAVIVLCCLVGNEQHSAHFERGRAAFEKDAGLDVVEDPTIAGKHVGDHADLDEGDKPDTVHYEHANTRSAV